MKVVRMNYADTADTIEFPSLVMALGYFDGVHLGHKKVIQKAKQIADEKGLKSAVMTFDPHPSVVLGKGIKQVDTLTSHKDKEKFIETLGIDYLFIMEFTKEFANVEPEQFVEKCIVDLHVEHVVAGFDYTYGRLAKGTMETLPELANNRFAITVIPKETYKGEKVSSTFIRSQIMEGNVEVIESVLGRLYTVEGVVIDGDKRGRTIGFPTANVKPSYQVLLPAKGVYAVRIQVDGEWYEAVCNVGTKPTFHPEKTEKTIEVHIFDFDQYIYGKSVTVEWHKRIRDEKKFDHFNELITQINKDKQTAIHYFEEIQLKNKDRLYRK